MWCIIRLIYNLINTQLEYVQLAETIDHYNLSRLDIVRKSYVDFMQYVIIHR